MNNVSWPSKAELDEMRELVAEMAGRGTDDVSVVVSPYRICPLGAHIDHQGGNVLAMTINKGILLGFVPSGGSQVILHSGQFKGEVTFSVDEILHPIHTVKASDKTNEECNWGNYARGALYALQSRGNLLTQGIIGFVSGSEDLDSSGLSSSAAVGVAYLLAFESANNLDVSPTENIEYDRLIENDYLGLKNGILDQSAILLSRYGCLTCMNCKTKEHKLVHLPRFQNLETEMQKGYKILLAFSGLKYALTSNPGYNCRVAECREAARLLLHASGNEELEPLLSNVEPTAYEIHKSKLEPRLARRAEHYFSENARVTKEGVRWCYFSHAKDAPINVLQSRMGTAKKYSVDAGTATGMAKKYSVLLTKIGSEPLIQLYELLVRAPGVYGARFSGAGFRGCCIAFVAADSTNEASSFVRNEYQKLQPKLSSQINRDKAVLLCDAGDGACVI